jgi:predicted flap endonuclease-1-like 5' DNA nuclease
MTILPCLLGAITGGLLIGAGWSDRRRAQERESLVQESRSQLDAAARAMQQRDVQIRTLQLNLTTAGEQADAARRDVTRMRTDLGAARTRIAELEPLGSQLRQRDDELQRARTQIAELEPLGGQLRHRDDELLQFRVRVDELERRAGEAEQRSREVTALQGRLAEREAALRRAEEELARARAAEHELAEHQTRLGELQTLIADTRRSDEELARLRSRVAELTGAREALQEWRRRYEELDGAMREQSRARDAEIAGLRAELDAARSAALVPAAAIAAPRVARGAARPRAKDDLKRIHGVGPKLEKFLNRRGIFLFSQVASWDGVTVDRIESELPQFKGRIARENWVGSARAEYIKKYGREPE